MNTRKEWKCLFLIIVIFISACIETDIYLPAFPDMMRAFSTTEGAIQGLLTWNFIGICLSGPLYGPISDAFGRKRPILMALGLFLLGSIITCCAQNLDQMLWGRILQGLGSGGCFTLGTAIVFDIFQKEKAIKATNTLNTIVPLIMAGAPMIGGYLNHTFGYRSNFLAIAILVLVSAIVSLFFFDETLDKDKRTSFQMGSILKDFKQAFCCLGFWQITVVISLLFGSYIAFLSGSSVLFVLEFGVSKALFPYFQGAILGGWVAGSLLMNKALAKWGAARMKRMGIIFVITGTLWLMVGAIVTPQNPWVFTSAMMIYSFGGNWIIGLYFPEGMELLAHTKGIAASLMTSMRLLVAALVVGLASALYNATVYPLVGVVGVASAILLFVIQRYEKRRVASSPETAAPFTH